MKYCLYAALTALLFGIFLQIAVVADDSEKLPIPVVGIAEVSTSKPQITRSYTGQIVSRSVIRIVSRCSGEILDVGFNDGDYVQKDQVLYRIDPIQYESLAKNAKAKVDECKAKLQFANNNYNRNKRLYEVKNAVSLETVENSKAELDSAQALLESAEAEQIAADDNLAKTIVKAPESGLAGVTNFTKGNYVTPESETLVTIVQTHPIRVQFSISYADYLSLFGSPESLKEQGVVNIVLSDGTNYPETGTIELLNNEINPRTDSIQVFAHFENKDSKLITGGIVKVILTRQSNEESLAVPSTAILYDKSGSYVFVINKDNRAEKRRVKTGFTTEDYQFIEDGLQFNERVVVKGTHKLESGSIVSPQL